MFYLSCLVQLDLYPAYAEMLYSDVLIRLCNFLFFLCCMDLYHLRQGLHVIATSWNYHRGAEDRVSSFGNLVRFTCVSGLNALFRGNEIAKMV